MPDALELIAVEVSANLDKLDSQMQGSARIVDVNAQRITQSVQRAEQQIVRSADNAGDAMNRTGGASRQFAMQFSQMGQQVAAGTSPLQAFAIQLPDLAVVMGQTGAEAGRLASFFGGPWGIALTTAAAVMIPFISRLFETGDAATTATSKVDNMTAALGRLRAAQSRATAEDLGYAQADVFGKQGNVNRLQSLYDRSGQTLTGAQVQGKLKERLDAAKTELQTAQDLLKVSRMRYDVSNKADAADERAIAAKREQSAANRDAAAAARRADREARAAAKQQQRLDDQYDRTKDQLVLEGQLAELRAKGTDEANRQADIMEVQARLAAQFPALEKERLAILQQIAEANINFAYNQNAQKQALDDFFREAEQADKEREKARKKASEDLARREQDQIRTLASLYEDAFRGGTKSIWQDFKDIGFSVIAQVLARFTIAKLGRGGGGTFDFGGAFASAIGSVLPGFATGGSIAIGGRGGTDNNVLAVNGRPVARVSNGETLHITNPNLSRGSAGGAIIQQTFVLDNRGGITTPELIDYVNQTANARAIQASSAMGQAVMKAVPSRLASYNRDGT